MLKPQVLLVSVYKVRKNNSGFLEVILPLSTLKVER